MISERLTEVEQKQLQGIIKGYGSLKEAANKVKINRLTLSRIAFVGSGYRHNVIKVRKKLLEPLTKPIL